MKKVLIENLWLMAIGWCLYLNDHILASAAIMCFAALYSLYVIGEVDVLRCAVTFIGIYILTLCLYLAGNIPYFFPSLHIFMAAVMFDVFACIEYFASMKRKDLLPILMFVFGAMIAIFIAIAAAPEDEYTLFSKASLYLFGSFIFLPYLIPMTYCYVVRTLRVIERRSIQKQGV